MLSASFKDERGRGGAEGEDRGAGESIFTGTSSSARIAVSSDRSLSSRTTSCHGTRGSSLIFPFVDGRRTGRVRTREWACCSATELGMHGGEESVSQSAGATS